MHGWWLNASGNPYFGDRQGNDIPVTEPPNSYSTWDGSQWVFDPVKSNAYIDAQIDALERQSLVPRPVREGLLLIWSTVIQILFPGTTVADMINPASPKFQGVGFRKFYDFNQSIVALRAQRVP